MRLGLHRGAVPSRRLIRPRRTAAVARGSADLASPINPRQGLSFLTASVRNPGYDQVRIAPIPVAKASIAAPRNRTLQKSVDRSASCHDRGIMGLAGRRPHRAGCFG